MASFKCKKCKAKIMIPKEWIELGISRIVTCNTCGHKMNLVLDQNTNKQKKGTDFIENLQKHKHSIETPTGTQVDGMSSGTSTNKYSLEVIEGKKQTLSLDVGNIENTQYIYIGRNPASKRSINADDVVWILDDPYVSRLHCLISIEKQAGQAKFILNDEGSVNGTSVNQNPLEEGDKVLLHIGDQIMIGDIKIILKKN